MIIAQFSDLHFAPKTLDESERCFASAIDSAIQAGAQCGVISGDSTDHALDVHAPAFEALAKLVKHLADHMPVLMLQGTWSHEPPGTLNVFRLLGGKHPINVADRIEQVALTGDGWVASASWCFDTIPEGSEALFSCVPTLNKASIAGSVGGATAAAEHGELLAALLRGFSKANAAATARGIATVGVSHGTINGCTTEHGVPMAGLDHEFTTGALFGAGAQAFMLGHIHKHQVWQQGSQVIAYPGSIGRFHYGELGTKGFLLWDVSAFGARCELVGTPAKRTIELSFAGPPDLDAIREVAGDAKGAFVRVRWEVSEATRHEVDRAGIERALQGATEVKLEGRVIPVGRSRAAGIGLAASIEEKLSRWALVMGQNGAELDARLALLKAQDTEAVVAQILGRPQLARGAPEPLLNAAPDEPVETVSASFNLFE
jgi:exonuclease SbcD